MNADRLTTRTMARLQGIANEFARDPMDADDIMSEILEALARLSSDEDSNSRIFTKARWIALHHVRDEHIYDKYVGAQSEAEVAHASNADDERDDVDVLFIESVTPETVVEQQQEADALELAIGSLDITDQKIVKLLQAGFAAAEIAKKMAVSRSAVSQRMTKIARRFTAMGFAQ